LFSGLAGFVAQSSSSQAQELALVMAPAFFLSVVAFVAGSEGLTSWRELGALNAEARARITGPLRLRLLIWFASTCGTVLFARWLWSA
jgi:hypothetical protein